MNQPKSSAEVSETFSEADIADYLRSHPDFFERHAALLLGLRLPHPTGASAVSLVERQVAMLRQRSGALERQLKDLVAVAKANNALVEKIHRLAIELMAQSDFTARLDVLEASLREHFAAERAALVLFGDKTTRDEANPGFVQIIKRDDPALKPFSAFLRAARPRCGQIRDRQRQFVFGREADSVASAAMLPLGESAKLGFLIIGSRDADYFHPGKRMDFLGRLGELVSVAVDSELVRSGRN